MAERKRVFHPETYEPFDVPVGKANDLILNEGWLQQAPDPDAERAVTTVEAERGTPAASEEAEDWRDSEVGDEAVEYDETEVEQPAPPRPRKSKT